MDIISPSVLLIVALIVVFSKDILKDISEEGKALAFLLSCMAIVLAVSAFAKISLDPFRQALDFATVLALLVAVLVSMVASIPKNKLVSILLVLIIGFGLYHNLPTWFGYNSAIRQADREAIAYVNTLNLDIYNCSAEVAPWIYDRFTEPKYKSPPEEGGIYAPILIKRDTPMTPRGDPENMWYERHGLEPDDNYVPLKSFSDNKVTITIYGYIGEQ